MFGFMAAFADEPEPPALQEYLKRHTLSGAVNQARQQQQVNPVIPFKPVERLPLSTTVILCNGVEAVITAHSTCDCNSYRVSWFDRRQWAVRWKWLDRGTFVVVETKNAQRASQSVSR